VDILLAEDDHLQSRLLEHHLLDRGFTVRTAFDARSAWESAERNPPDAILLDLQMPGGTGLTFLKKKNASARLRSVPVIVITAVEDALVRRMAEQQGAQTIFSKPVDLMLLDVTLESVRSRLPQPRGAEEAPGSRK